VVPAAGAEAARGNLAGHPIPFRLRTLYEREAQGAPRERCRTAEKPL